MQFLSAQPLIDDFRSGTFDDEDLAPYVLLPAVLGTLALGLGFGEFDPGTPWPASPRRRSRSSECST